MGLEWELNEEALFWSNTLSGGRGGQPESHWALNKGSFVEIGGAFALVTGGSNAIIGCKNGGAHVVNSGFNVNIHGGSGSDSLNNLGSRVNIKTGAGNNRVETWGEYCNINAGSGNDYIYNTGSEVNISTGKGRDTVHVDFLAVQMFWLTCKMEMIKL